MEQTDTLFALVRTWPWYSQGVPA